MHETVFLVAAWGETLLSKNTRAVYGSRVRRWLEWCAAEKVDPLAATSADVGAYLRPYVGQSDMLRARRSALTSWYDYLVKLGHVDVNPLSSESPACSFAGCSRDHYGLGYCRMHYKRFKAHGDPSVVKTRPMVWERTCTECEYHGPRTDFWGDRRICKACRPSFEARSHAEKAERGALKRCSGCSESKTLDQFTRNQALCKPCAHAHKGAQQAARRAANVPILCQGSCGQLLSPNQFDPGFVKCRRCRFLENPEVYRQNWRRRRVRRLGAVGNHTDSEWARLLNRHRGMCAYCQAAPAVARDHVVPLVRGGSDFASNLLPTCTSCNSQKHDSLLSEWRYRRGGAPALSMITARPLRPLP
ncbi:HNH endonuclease [Nonomuraea zeae]|uniref:Core-binding (CB) domain-containing protein n=1 Tax=Nonomuraea zeae TaxID=1642303 RepID=A0A5S4HEL9_9ACTN|nr:hypothetical protein ETD85_08390 [Nonomuraea zeae]